MAIQVVAGIIYQSDRLLVCQRREDASFPLKWEFPGGKVEPGEEYWAALQRELREELGIEIRSATEVFRHIHLYPGPVAVELLFFRVDAYEGVIRNQAFHRLLWAQVEKLPTIDFLEGDLPLIEKIVRREL
jgi:8-oxo-dGTP diphosphatase